MARDILLFVLLLALLVGVIIVVAKISSVLKDIKKMVADAQKMIETLTENVAKPAASNSGVAYNAGKVGAFLLGFGRNRRKKRDSDNGK